MSHRVVLAIGLLAAACTKQDSSNILTRGMYASMSAIATGDGSTDVSATLFLENPGQLDFIELHGGDRLVAWQGTTSRVMSETDILNIVSYHASFGIDDADTEFRVQFERTVDDGAPESTTTLPPPFELTTLPMPTSSRAAELTVDWAPAGQAEPLSWSVSGDCIDAASGMVTGDPGTLTIGANTLRKKMQQEGQPTVPDSCQVTLYLSRSRDGDVDPAFEQGGTFSGTQRRSTQFTSAP